jgi:hypothetical protein
VPEVQTTCQAEMGGSLESRNSRPAWAIQRDPISRPVILAAQEAEIRRLVVGS